MFAMAGQPTRQTCDIDFMATLTVKDLDLTKAMDT